MLIPDVRLLSSHEAALIQWMQKHGTVTVAVFLPQLAVTRIVSRCGCGCGCGCASVDISVGGVVPPPGQPMGLLADFEYRTVKEELCGAFVFERGGLLAGLEGWSVDGLSTPSTWPAIDELQPLETSGRPNT